VARLLLSSDAASPVSILVFGEVVRLRVLAVNTCFCALCCSEGGLTVVFMPHSSFCLLFVLTLVLRAVLLWFSACFVFTVTFSSRFFVVSQVPRLVVGVEAVRRLCDLQGLEKCFVVTTWLVVGFVAA
jgi:hypothetical protein